jgi:hypothetical protein
MGFITLDLNFISFKMKRPKWICETRFSFTEKTMAIYGIKLYSR